MWKFHIISMEFVLLDEIFFNLRAEFQPTNANPLQDEVILTSGYYYTISAEF